jgi:hypothetical protein
MLVCFITIGIGRPGPNARPVNLRITGAWSRLY